MKKTKYEQFDNQIDLSAYFDKEYQFTSGVHRKLPTKIFESEKWAIPKFQQKKTELNQVKEQLGKFNLEEWSKHTKSRDPSSRIIRTLRSKYQVELLTQAWCKFYECVSKYDLIPKSTLNTQQFYSVHICEAPGAFICSLNHYLSLNHPDIKWKWQATTLNPNYEGNCLSKMIPDDRLIKYTLENWQFGSDFTGDITKNYNRTSLLESYLRNGKAQLVTADGSIDCMINPGDQERMVEHLHFCEVMIALDILEKGGTLLMKMFTMFEESIICLMYLLNCCFDVVNVFKPCTSKSGNSEIYVICLNFVGKNKLGEIWPLLQKPLQTGSTDKSMFSLNDIDHTFLQQISDCSTYFMEKQICTINENVKYFRKKSFYELAKLKCIHEHVTKHFMNTYRIASIPNGRRIVRNVNISNLFFCDTIHYNDISQLHVKINVESVLCKNLSYVGEVLDIIIGERIEAIRHSKYIPRDLKNFHSPRKEIKLCEIVRFYLKSQNNVICVSDFDIDLVQLDDHQRQFFNVLRNSLECCKNLIMVGIPLVTNFTVGLVYLIMLAYDSVCFFNKIIVFENPCVVRMNAVKKCLERINEIYLAFEHRYYIEDVLQVVSVSLLQRGTFFHSVYKYNCNVIGACEDACT